MAGAVVVVVVVVVSMLVVLMVVLLLWRRKNNMEEKAGNGLDLSNPNYDSCKILIIIFFCCRYSTISDSPEITYLN